MPPARLALSLCFSVAAFAASIPIVGSGTLVAHFRVSDSAVSRDGNGYVTSWTADNNPGIVLNAAGSTPSNIAYNAAGMNGAPVIEVNDFSNQNQYMTGALPGTLTSTTIFWLGYYQPGRSGSLTDSAGQYVYSFGADGADGSQMDHQTDGGNFELFGGSGTQTGNSIVAQQGVYTIWRTQYGEGTGNGHSAFAGNASLGIPSPNGGNYSASGNLVLFGFQGTTPGVSDGFNFVGNFAELIIYNGILSSGDTALVEAYLANRAAGDLGDPETGVPEPGTWATVAATLAILAWVRRRR